MLSMGFIPLKPMREILIREIEKHFGQTLHTHRGFLCLSQAIADAKHGCVSATTLKRVWGKQSDYTKCSLYTLNLLARYLDFPDYDAFCRSKRREIESRHFLVPTYSSSRFHVGDELSLEWVPECRVVVRYEGHLRFVVVSSENAPLCVNDTFECLSFIEGEALQLSNLEHGGQGPFVYVAGRMGGVHIVPAEEGEFTLPHSCKPPVQARQATELRTGRSPLPSPPKTCATEPLRLFWLRQGGSVAFSVGGTWSPIR